jgi:hypothetical protein
MKLILCAGHSTHLTWQMMEKLRLPIDQYYQNPENFYQLLHRNFLMEVSFWITLTKATAPPKKISHKKNTKDGPIIDVRDAVPASNKNLTVYLQFLTKDKKIPDPWLQLAAEYPDRVEVYKEPEDQEAFNWLTNDLGYTRWVANGLLIKSIVKEGSYQYRDYIYLSNLIGACPPGSSIEEILTYGLASGTDKVDFKLVSKSLGYERSVSLSKLIEPNEAIPLFAYLGRVLSPRLDGMYYYLAACRKAADDTTISYLGAVQLFIYWYYLYKSGEFKNTIEASEWIHKVLTFQ